MRHRAKTSLAEVFVLEPMTDLQDSLGIALIQNFKTDRRSPLATESTIISWVLKGGCQMESFKGRQFIENEISRCVEWLWKLGMDGQLHLCRTNVSVLRQGHEIRSHCGAIYRAFWS